MESVEDYDRSNVIACSMVLMLNTTSTELHSATTAGLCQSLSLSMAKTKSMHSSHPDLTDHREPDVTVHSLVLMQALLAMKPYLVHTSPVRHTQLLAPIPSREFKNSSVVCID